MTSDGETIEIKIVELKKLKNIVVDNFLFEFIEGLKQSIYAQINIICGESKLNKDTSEYWVWWLVDSERIKMPKRGRVNWDDSKN